MPHNEFVQRLMNAIGPFYEFVDDNSESLDNKLREKSESDSDVDNECERLNNINSNKQAISTLKKINNNNNKNEISQKIETDHEIKLNKLNGEQMNSNSSLSKSYENIDFNVRNSFVNGHSKREYESSIQNGDKLHTNNKIAVNGADALQLQVSSIDNKTNFELQSLNQDNLDKKIIEQSKSNNRSNSLNQSTTVASGNLYFILFFLEMRLTI
jgi:hypothetical protein